MPSTYSSNLKIELMSTGENSGTWGNITNTNLGTALEQAVVGYGAVSYASDANLTISITNSNAAQAARALVLNVTSAVSLTGTRELVVPTIEKQYIVQNNTTGSQSITVKTSAGTGITVPNGRKAHLYVDGTNVIQMFDFVDINGGAIDGTPIGASSASTGAFTTLNASGATTLDGNVTLGNASGDNVTVTGTITSNLLFTDNTYDIGASGATRPRNLFLAGAATIGGNLSVGGTLTLTGGVNLNGNVTVGDSSADTLTVNATITSNLLFTDNTYDIGASGATRPRNLFLAGNATIGGNQTLTGALTVDSTTDSSSTTTGSIQTDGGLGVAKALFVGTSGTIQNVLGVGAASTTDAVALFDSLNVNGSHIRLLNANTANTYFGAAAGISSSGTASDTALRAQGALYLLTNGNNPRVTVTTDGYVGIRTTSPVGFLHVAPGNAASSGAGAPIILQAQQGAASSAGGNVLIGSGQNGPGGSNGFIAFGIGSATTGSTFASGEAARFDTNSNLLIGLTSALANGKLQIAGGIGLSGNTQIRQATNSDGNTLQVFATQFVAGLLNSTSYGYSGGGLIASVSASDSTTLFDAGRATSTDGRFKVLNTTSANTAISLEKNSVYTLYASTAAGRVGIGTNSPQTTLQVNAAAPTIRLQESTTGGDKRLEMGVNSSGQAFIGANQSAQSLALQTVNSTRVTIGSTGNVTVAGDGYLDVVNGYVRAGGGSDQGTQLTMWTESGGDAGIAAYVLRFFTGNNSARTERMRMNNVGQLGVGTTSFQTQSPAGSISYPQNASIQTGSFARAWNPAQQIGQVGTSGLYGMAHTYLAYYDAGWKSLGGGVASALTMDEGILSFSNSNGVGASGSALTWTTRFVCDTGGRFLSGLTSTKSNNAQLQVRRTDASVGASTYALAWVQNATGYEDGFVVRATDNLVSIGADYGGTNHGVGLAFLVNNSAGAFGATEAARFDSSGRFFIGATSPSFGSKFVVEKNGGDVVGFGETSGTAGNVIQTNKGGANGSDTTTTYIVFQRSDGTERGTIQATGTNGVVYNTTSDYRLKTVVGPVSGAGERIDALEPVEYIWKEDGTTERGFLAHKFKEVYSRSVSGEKDEVGKGGKPKYQSMQASSGEVMADLIAEIQSLRKRVAQLESK